MDRPFRVQPLLDDHDRAFWTSRSDGSLRIQLRGEAGERQVVPHGRPSGRVEVAAVGNGGGPVAGAMLPTRMTGR